MLFGCAFLTVTVESFVFSHYGIYIRSEKSLQVIIHRVVKRQSPKTKCRKVAGGNRIEEWEKGTVLCGKMSYSKILLPLPKFLIGKKVTRA